MSMLEDLPKTPTGNPSTSTDAALARSAILFQSMRKLQAQINEENAKKNAQPTKLDFKTAAENHIPVVYGDAFVKGTVTDARLAAADCVMWVCMTLCEVTGDLLSTEDLTDPDNPTYDPSEITFADLTIENQKVTFQEDGITVASLEDEDGNVNEDVNGLIKIYLYNNGSTSPAVLEENDKGAEDNAYDIFPGWGSTHTMDELVFALVRVEYDAVKKVTTLPDIQFKLSNTMRKPGDCIWDYLRNARYGAGLTDAQIWSDEE